MRAGRSHEYCMSRRYGKRAGFVCGFSLLPQMVRTYMGRRKNYVLCRKNYIRHNSNYNRPFFSPCNTQKNKLLMRREIKRFEKDGNRTEKFIFANKILIKSNAKE